MTLQHFAPLLRFVNEDDGAQIIEYALIIAVVSLTLLIALRGLTDGSFMTWINRVGNCLTTSTCT